MSFVRIVACGIVGVGRVIERDHFCDPKPRTAFIEWRGFVLLALPPRQTVSRPLLRMPPHFKIQARAIRRMRRERRRRQWIRKIRNG